MVGLGIGIGVGIKLATALKALLAAGAVVAVVSVLTWERVRSWFQDRVTLCTQNDDHVAFSLVENLSSGQYKTVYGIFNKRTETVVEAEAVSSRSLDETLRRHHAREPLVVYR